MGVSNPSSGFGMGIPPCDLLRHPQLLHLSVTSVCSPPSPPPPPSPSQFPLIANIMEALAKPQAAARPLSAPVISWVGRVLSELLRNKGRRTLPMGRRNFPLGGYSQPGSRDAVPWLVSPTSTLRGSCARGQPPPVLPRSQGIAQKRLFLEPDTPPPHSGGDRLQSPDPTHCSSLQAHSAGPWQEVAPWGGDRTEQGTGQSRGCVSVSPSCLQGF